MRLAYLLLGLMLAFDLFSCDPTSNTTTYITTTQASTTTTSMIETTTLEPQTTTISTTTFVSQTTTMSTTTSTTIQSATTTTTSQPTTTTTTQPTTTTTTTMLTTTTSMTTEDENSADLASMIQVMDDYDFLDHNGFDYRSYQYIDATLVNYDEIEQRIVHDTAIRLYTAYRIGRLAEFNTEEDITETIIIEYYDDNRIGSYDDQGDLIWTEMLLSEYMDFALPTLLLSLDRFETFTFTHDGSSLILSANIKASEIDNVLGLVSSDILSLSLEIEINVETDSLVDIEMDYTASNTSTWIRFAPYDYLAQVTIPS